MKFKREISTILAVVMMVTGIFSTSAVFAQDGAEKAAVEQEVLAEEPAPETEKEEAEKNDLEEVKENEEKAQATETKVTKKSDKKKLADEIDIKPVLKAKAVKNRVYKNTSGKFKVKFTASWSNKVKYRKLLKEGWTFTYKLVNQNNKVIVKQLDYKKGFIYTVKKGSIKYKLVVLAKKKGEKNQKLQSLLVKNFTFPAKPKKIIAKCPKSTNNARIKWSEVEDAAYYYLYRSRKKSKVPHKPIAKVKGRKYVDKNLPGDKKYYYYVQTVFKGEKTGNTYFTASKLLGPSKRIKVKRYATCPVRPIRWYAHIHRKTKLYKKPTGGASRGTLKKGQKVFVTKSYPGRVKYGSNPKRVYILIRSKSGRVKKRGWVNYNDASGILGEVTYIASKKKAYDWTREVKEKWVNKKKLSSPTKYLIWISTFTQRVNIFKGKKGHWKLIRTHRCVTGKFLHRTGISYNDKIWKRKPQRVRNFFQKTSKYYYTHLSFFSPGNSIHSVCWYYGTKRVVNNVKSNLQPGTRGCVRCYLKDAIWVYKNIPMKTRVVVY